MIFPLPVPTGDHAQCRAKVQKRHGRPPKEKAPRPVAGTPFLIGPRRIAYLFIE
jgi:hypothetical protein